MAGSQQPRDPISANQVSLVPASLTSALQSPAQWTPSFPGFHPHRRTMACNFSQLRRRQSSNSLLGQAVKRQQSVTEEDLKESYYRHRVRSRSRSIGEQSLGIYDSMHGFIL